MSSLDAVVLGFFLCLTMRRSSQLYIVIYGARTSVSLLTPVAALALSAPVADLVALR